MSDRSRQRDLGNRMIEETHAEVAGANQRALTNGATKGLGGAGGPADVGQPAVALPRNESVVTRLMRMGHDEVDALLEAVGMRARLSGEAKDLARLVERRLAEVDWGTHAEAVDEIDIQRAFLVHRFVGPMKQYERSSRGYSILDNFLNLTSILAGVGASLAAALEAPKVYAIAFGLIVGFLQSVSQWLKPAQRSTRRGLTATALRGEAWAYLQRRERYRGKDDRAAWALLADQVNRLEAREAAEHDKEGAQVYRSRSPVTS